MIRKNNMHFYFNAWKQPTHMQRYNFLFRDYTDVYDWKRWYLVSFLILKRWEITFGVSDRNHLGNWLLKRFYKRNARI